MWRSVECGHRGPRGCEATLSYSDRDGRVVRHGDKHPTQQARCWAQRVEVGESFKEEVELEPGLKMC